jgi:hypothetical protein
MTKDKIMYTRQEVGSALRRVITDYSKKSIKALHPDIRLYNKQAEGDWPASKPFNSIGLTFNKLLDLLRYVTDGFVEDSGLDLEFTLLDANAKNNVKMALASACIPYNKDTRFHNLIDYVYQTYVEAYNKKNSLGPYYDSGSVKISNEEAEAPMTNAEDTKTPDKDVEFWVISIFKNGVTYYIRQSVTSRTYYDYIEGISNAKLFRERLLEESFDLDADDVINSIDKPANAHLVNTLKNILPPFDLNFIKYVPQESEHWTYGEEELLENILSKLSDADRKFIKDRLK